LKIQKGRVKILEMRDKQIILPQNLFNEKVTLALLQLRSPFYREAAVIRGMEEPILGWIEPQHDERKRRLKTLLISLQRFRKHIDLLIFPEYAVSNEMLSQLEEFSLDNKTLVIGTFYDAKVRRNLAFAIFPLNNAPEIVTACKSQRSIFEVDVLQELPDEDREFLRLTWYAKGEQLSLLILPCLDFLQWPDLPAEIKDSDILVSPMASPTTESFQSIAQVAIRWVRPGQKRNRSRVCILCNTVDLSGGGLRTCGESRVIGVTRHTLPPLRSGVEAGLLLDLDCQKLITVPTPITGQDGAPIEAGSAFLLDEEWRIHWQQLEEVRVAPPEIHPNAPSRVGLHKYYCFAQVKRYWKHNHQLRNIPIGCSAVYGFHDILLHSYEESLELMKLRLQAYSPTVVFRDLQLDEQDCFKVTGALKYRGVMFADRKEGIHSFYKLDDLEGLDPEGVDKCLRLFHGSARKSDINEEVRRELVEKCIGACQ
jgi:hypothetical protein